jgi:hypothetical protein
MGNRGYNAGGFAYMPRVQCVLCGRTFPIGKSNPRRTCLNKKACEARRLKAGSDSTGGRFTCLSCGHRGWRRSVRSPCPACGRKATCANTV